jgi:hypothetical protein
MLLVLGLLYVLSMFAICCFTRVLRIFIIAFLITAAY